MYSELTKMEGKRIVIRTFGYFDIFVDGETRKSNLVGL